MVSTSTPMLPEWRRSSGSSSGTTGRSFTTVSPPRPATRRARTTTPAWLSCEVGRVEEEDLPDLRLERIEPERGDRGAVRVLGQRHLQLDGVGALEECEEVCELVTGKVGEALWG